MKLFGTTINQATEIIQAKLELADAGNIDEKIKLAESFTKVAMTVVVSLFIFAFFGYALLTSDNPDMQKISAGFIGTAIGYWLK